MPIIERVKNILVQPKVEWRVIEAEQTTTQELYTGYIMLLAAIGPLATLVGLSMVGMQVPFVGAVRFPLSTLLTQAVLAYVLGLAGVYILALIINALAPTFAGTQNTNQALKVAAYASTAAWVGGIFSLLPLFAVLGLLAALYSLYLLYLGLPVLMKSPPDRSVGYTIAVVIAAIVIFVVIGVLTSTFMTSPIAVSQDPAVEQATKQLEQLTKGLEKLGAGMEGRTQGGRGQTDAEPSGADPLKSLGDAVQSLDQAASGGKSVEPVNFRQLKDLLPDALPGMQRTDATGEKTSALGITLSKAEGTYRGPEHGSVTITISDIGAMSGLAGMALYAWANGEIDKESSTGYEKTTTYRGYKAYEKYDKADRSGELDVLISNRFVVHVEGSDITIEDLRSVLNKVDLSKLATLKA
ncbi:MAG: Yip1 family protein [Nitrospiraceae bacterium]